MKLPKLYLIFHIRIMNHGELIHNEKSEKICMKKEIADFQKELAEQFKVEYSAVAFSYTELPSFEKIVENYNTN
jgi:hypothetical protein